MEIKCGGGGVKGREATGEGRDKVKGAEIGEGEYGGRWGRGERGRSCSCHLHITYRRMNMILKPHHGKGGAFRSSSASSVTSVYSLSSTVTYTSFLSFFILENQNYLFSWNLY